jgi:hypothetical protein
MNKPIRLMFSNRSDHHAEIPEATASAVALFSTGTPMRTGLIMSLVEWLKPPSPTVFNISRDESSPPWNGLPFNIESWWEEAGIVILKGCEKWHNCWLLHHHGVHQHQQTGRA